jgi:endoribonuclease LACTB2
VYGDTPPHVWPIARMSLEAHLLKLEREGKATRAGEGWRA